MGAWVPPVMPEGDVKLAVAYPRWSWRLRRCAITNKRIWGPAWQTVEYQDELVERQVGRLTMHGTRRSRINRWLSAEGHTFWLLRQGNEK